MKFSSLSNWNRNAIFEIGFHVSEFQLGFIDFSLDRFSSRDETFVGSFKSFQIIFISKLFRSQTLTSFFLNDFFSMWTKKSFRCSNALKSFRSEIHWRIVGHRIVTKMMKNLLHQWNLTLIQSIDFINQQIEEFLHDDNFYLNVRSKRFSKKIFKIIFGHKSNFN